MQTSEYFDPWARGFIDPASITDKMLFTRITQVVTWCVERTADDTFDPKMRSEKLLPRLFHQGGDDLVCDVGHSIAMYIRRKTNEVTEQFPDLRGGKLLLYFPDEDLSDGAAEVESKGFFDVYNAPPWDTWVAYFEEKGGASKIDRNYLLAYVPQKLVSLANAGIDVNPEECIQWLEKESVQLKCRLLKYLR